MKSVVFADSFTSCLCYVSFFFLSPQPITHLAVNLCVSSSYCGQASQSLPGVFTLHVNFLGLFLGFFQGSTFVFFVILWFACCVDLFPLLTYYIHMAYSVLLKFWDLDKLVCRDLKVDSFWDSLYFCIINCLLYCSLHLIFLVKPKANFSTVDGKVLNYSKTLMAQLHQVNECVALWFFSLSNTILIKKQSCLCM